MAVGWSKWLINYNIAFEAEDWGKYPKFIETMEKFSNIKVSDRHRMGKPWSGCLYEL
jgi:hypothetical protein